MHTRTVFPKRASTIKLDSTCTMQGQKLRDLQPKMSINTEAEANTVGIKGVEQRLQPVTQNQGAEVEEMAEGTEEEVELAAEDIAEVAEVVAEDMVEAVVEVVESMVEVVEVERVVVAEAESDHHQRIPN